MRKVFQKPFGGKSRLNPNSVDRGVGKDFDREFNDDWLDQFPIPEYLTDDQQEVVDLLREGFNTLSDMQKRVILMLVDQKCTERKAAEILGIHHSTLSNHLNRARKKLVQYVVQNSDIRIDRKRGFVHESKGSNKSINNRSSENH